MPTPSADPEHTRDLSACRALLRKGSKSFSLASLLLPRRVREPTAAIYAFCRVADDEVDTAASAAGAIERLSTRLDGVFAGAPRPDPIDRALARVVRDHQLPRAPFDALLEGFAWDVGGRRYETFDDVLAYSARAAGTVGVLMTRLMGPCDRETLARACDLGVAMQLTNIARDVGEDAQRGRVYLPEAWLVEAGTSRDALIARPERSPALASVVERLVTEAEALYCRADLGVARLPQDCRLAIAAARAIYSAIDGEIARRGFDSITERAHVSLRRKLALVVRAYFASRRAQPPQLEAAPLPALAAASFLLPEVAS